MEAARRQAADGIGHAHEAAEQPGSVWEKLGRASTWVSVSQSFVMDVSMLWKDLVLGFLIAGGLAAFVPNGVWQALFVQGHSAWVMVPANALLGPLVAVLSFVCSIGNVPLAAVLWGSGVSFGGVLAFLYADLIVLPLLDVYRRYYGWRMAAYIAAVFYTTMVLAAIVMDVAFKAFGWLPQARPDVRAAVTHFAFDYTFGLNLVAIMVCGRPGDRVTACACGGQSLRASSLRQGKASSPFLQKRTKKTFACYACI